MSSVVRIAVRTILLIVILALIVVTVWLSMKVRNSEIADIPEQKSVAVGLSSRIMMTGEVFWGRYARDTALANEQGYSYLFSGLSAFDKDKYDAWLAQLECPITSNSLTSAEQEATLTFNCRPEFLDEAAKWFDVFSLATNHTDNMGGQAGLDETRVQLEEHGIQYYGHYENSVVDELCEIIALPVKINYIPASSSPAEFPVALCGYHNVFKLPTANELDVIKKYSKYFLTIISPHMGQEYVPAADEFKTDTFRAMIDRGADVVIGSHPHWVQNTEVYKGKLIMYSVGNFMFDQQQNNEVRRGVALDIGIEVKDSKNINRWLSADLECSPFWDNCLERAESLGLEKPTFELTYKVIPSFNTNYVTTVAPEDVKSAVLQRLNWQQTLNQLTE